MRDGSGANPKIDPSGELPDGRKFADADGLKGLMVADLDKFAAAFADKLATYALRRGMTFDDRKSLAEIAAQAKAQRLRAGHADRDARAQRPVPETLTTPGRTRIPMSNVLSQRWLLSRRHFLRGVGTTMALPLLGAMTPLARRRRRGRRRSRAGACSSTSPTA